MTKRTLFVDDWRFKKFPVETSLADACKELSDFQTVSLPHDWMIYQVSDLYETSRGFYVKEFTCHKETLKHYELYFEGVYMDCLVFLNGKQIGEWKYGYSSFFVSLDEALQDGENRLVVQVTYREPNTRWYSGAGIYRDVYWIEKEQDAFLTDSVYITSKELPNGDWSTSCLVEVSTAVQDGDLFEIEILEEAGKSVVKDRLCATGSLSKEDGRTPCLEGDICVSSPKLWSIEQPALYTCRLSWIRDGRVLDSIDTRIGFRTLSFDADRGLFLNGEHVKLFGVCEHHDFGALGAAFYKDALRRKLVTLRKMGVNAIRSTHNMPAVDLLNLADEMGFLVIDEAFDMWERPKTTYEYARFFKDWYEKDVASWVRRDRNHACLLFWSIGNEIYDTHADERGQEVTRLLRDAVKKHDYKGQANVSIGSNYMPWENAQKCADILKFAGYNYAEKYYKEHHAAHPDWFIYGSETASTVQSRGIYHFPLKQPVLADEDEQCSALGNSTTSWGAKNSEYCITMDRDAEFSLGQFIWTGFDYIGEPTPYHTKNSYFGQVDTAGFEKDSYYLYQASWSKKPMMHLYPYWNFNPGQLIDVRIATNAASAELFVNGKSQGRQQIDLSQGAKLTADWQVAYEEGEILGVVYDENGKEVQRESRHSFGDAASLRLVSEQESVTYTRNAVVFCRIDALDEKGYPVENANNRVHALVKHGRILGMDNGDSTDTDEYKTNNKRLFSGKLLLMVAPDGTGDMEITVSSRNLQGATIVVPVKKEKTEFVPRVAEPVSSIIKEDKIWVRQVELFAPQGTGFTKGCEELEVEARIFPKEAMQDLDTKDICWKAVNNSGIESALVSVEGHGLKARLKAIGDGSFRLRCMVKNGCSQVKVISELEFCIHDLGIAYINPYQFVAGGLYTYSEGDLGTGNEHGVATARDGRSVVGFENLDFGGYGSDEITVPIFELGGDPCPIEIWEGVPESEGSICLAKEVYHKPSIWNVYQPETFRLSKRVSGISSIYFVLQQKIHIKGFSFTAKEKAYELLKATECERVYGDEYNIEETQISHIGNNVTIEFGEMDFGEVGATKLIICGCTRNDKDSIHLVFEGDHPAREILEFSGEGRKELSYEIAPVKGVNKVSLVFLPGTNFDLEYLKFMH